MPTDDDSGENLGVIGDWMVRRFWLFMTLLAAVVVSMVLVTLLVFEHKSSGLLGIATFIVIVGLSLRPILKARARHWANSTTRAQ